MTLRNSQTVAIIGAGIAGAACARALLSAGHLVHVFDKSRGPGGRLATRRIEWIDRKGLDHTTRFDHGAVGISARSDAFKNFLDCAVNEKRLAIWNPKIANGSLPFDKKNRIYVPTPDMPSLSRDLLDGANLTSYSAVEHLHKNPLGWQVEAAGACLPLNFNAIMLALPPAQAAPLLSPHRDGWAQQASAFEMQPCWTLMGIAEDPESVLPWELARPSSGPLDWLIRNDARPGRERSPGHAQWVLHAKADWSLQHLEQPAEWIQQQMQTALGEWLGQPVIWRHSVVHRWRYARPSPANAAASEPCWWDATQGLGVCGDFLGGAGVESIEGIERAWLSAQSLCAALLPHVSNASNKGNASAENVELDHLS